MDCPDCGSSAGEFRFATWVETHVLDCGPYETFNEEFIVCRECRGRYDVCGWEGSSGLKAEGAVHPVSIDVVAIQQNSLPDRQTGRPLATGSALSVTKDLTRDLLRGRRTRHELLQP